MRDATPMNQPPFSRHPWGGGGRSYLMPSVCSGSLEKRNWACTNLSGPPPTPKSSTMIDSRQEGPTSGINSKTCGTGRIVKNSRSTECSRLRNWCLAIPLVLCLGVPPAAYPPIVIVRHTLCSWETLTLINSELVVRNADSLFCVRQKRWRSILPVYLLMHIFVYSASAEVKTALAQAFLNGIYLILWTYRGSV